MSCWFFFPWESIPTVESGESGRVVLKKNILNWVHPLDRFYFLRGHLWTFGHVQFNQPATSYLKKTIIYIFLRVCMNVYVSVFQKSQAILQSH